MDYAANEIETVMSETTPDIHAERRIVPMDRKRIALLLIIPTCGDTFEQIGRNISNTMMPPSIAQMMRSSVVIFTAMLAVIFLKRKLYKHHYVSLVGVCLGLTLVALSTFLADNGTSNKTGLLLVLGIIL